MVTIEWIPQLSSASVGSVVATACGGGCNSDDSHAQAARPAVVAPYATGLTSPRDLTFGPDGLLYLAEAGNGGPLPPATRPTAADGTKEVGAGGSRKRLAGNSRRAQGDRL